ncbi:glutamyl-tRNA amidotransferase [Candidatus Acidianus copahuensis]|uniref:Glutamyl-tRNA(Gln) amidotransferase subunit E n=1 Tax=Candidatus Acidianus copahuensis TaxID=1160895 RepID=A0A031LME7_9CREN|nr:Glu-tRNA(Gln) amidotransferase subunit GatE [Candidatus Acidianus copahuensis]EZQ06813.1 glutamyl-tRNA amidotransferase [Candidatus Acidianus copahuensis]
MMEIDYSKVGLKVGLEIHQQLNTKNKLFCNCPTILDEKFKYTLTRFLRPVMSETGEIDTAALFEWSKNKEYIYQIPIKSSCLVECDEEPPHSINEEAILIGLAMTLAFHGNPIDEIYTMRKVVIDGSNTSGFQRTTIVGLGGYLDDDEGKVTIQTIAIEEDASRKVEDKREAVIYNLDRLGIPLIEISTGPDIHSPDQAKRVAFKIGQTLRLTGKVKRGLGTIRQDLNVSISGGVKTEIKGVQELDMIPEIVKNEALRQLGLLSIRDEIRKRTTKDEVEKGMIIKDLTKIFEETESKLIGNEIKRGGKVYGMRVPKFKGIFGIELEPNRRFGTEVSDYVKVLSGLGGIFHSDELPNYGITEKDVKKVKEELNVQETDGFIMIVGPKVKLDQAIGVIRERIIMSFDGVPKETRGSNPDGTTRFLRPQPGSARMYPETDIPPLRLTESLLDKAEKIVPPTPEEKMKQLLTLGLSDELAKQLINSPNIDLFEHLAETFSPKVSPSLIASTLENTIKYVKSQGGDISLINDHVLEEIFNAISEDKIAKDSVTEVLLAFSKEKGAKLEEIIKRYSSISEQDLENIIDEVINSSIDEIKLKKEKAFNLIMGRVMNKVRGRAEGKRVAELIKEKLQKLD